MLELELELELLVEEVCMLKGMARMLEEELA